MEHPFETLQVASRDGILVVLLDRPAAANAMNTQMGRDLLGLFARLAAEPEEARCVVLSATGERAFCAGGDLQERCGGTQNLPRAVGERRAKELILGGGAFSAEEGLAFGLVNRVCAPNQLMAEAIEAARRIAHNGPLAVRQAKHAIHHGLELSLANGMLFEIEAYNRLVPTDDRREGILAFNEKRPARFTGR